MNSSYSCLLVAALWISGCTGPDKDPKAPQSPAPAVVQASPVPAADSSWLSDFRAFRDAVYQGDRARVKSWFTFPLRKEDNEIWYWVETEDASAAAAHTGAFTGQDFDTYYAKIFPPAFIRTLLKIKSEDLYRTGESASPAISIEDGLNCTMYATCDKAAGTVSLNLAFEGNLADAEDMHTEYNAIYVFEIIGGRLHFSTLRMAG